MSKMKKEVGDLKKVKAGYIIEKEYEAYMSKENVDARNKEMAKYKELAGGGEVYISRGEGDFSFQAYSDDLSSLVKLRNEYYASMDQLKMAEIILDTAQQVKNGKRDLDEEAKKEIIKNLDKNTKEYNKRKEEAEKLKQRLDQAEADFNKNYNEHRDILEKMKKSMLDEPMPLQMTDEHYMQYLYFSQIRNKNAKVSKESEIMDYMGEFLKSTEWMAKDFDSMVINMLGQEQLDYCVKMRMDPVMLFRVNGKNAFDYAYEAFDKPEDVDFKKANRNKPSLDLMKASVMLAIISGKERVQVGEIKGLIADNRVKDIVTDYEVDKLKPVKVDLKRYEPLERAWYATNRSNLVEVSDRTHDQQIQDVWSPKHIDTAIKKIGNKLHLTNYAIIADDKINRFAANHNMGEFRDKNFKNRMQKTADYIATLRKTNKESKEFIRKVYHQENMTDDEARKDDEFYDQKYARALGHYDKETDYGQAFYNEFEIKRRELEASGKNESEITYELRRFLDDKKNEYEDIVNEKLKPIALNAKWDSLNNEVSKAYTSVFWNEYDRDMKDIQDRIDEAKKTNFPVISGVNYNVLSMHLGFLIEQGQKAVKMAEEFSVDEIIAADGHMTGSEESRFKFKDGQPRKLDVNLFPSKEQREKYLELHKYITESLAKAQTLYEKMIKNSGYDISVQQCQALYNEVLESIDPKKLKQSLFDYGVMTGYLIRTQGKDILKEGTPVNKEYENAMTGLYFVYDEIAKGYSVDPSKLTKEQMDWIDKNAADRKKIRFQFKSEDMDARTQNKQRQQIIDRMKIEAKYHANIMDHAKMQQVLHGDLEDSDYMNHLQEYTNVSRDFAIEFAKSNGFIMKNGMSVLSYINQSKKDIFEGLKQAILAPDNADEMLGELKNINSYEDYENLLGNFWAKHSEDHENARKEREAKKKAMEDAGWKLIDLEDKLKTLKERTAIYVENAEAGEEDIKRNAALIEEMEKQIAAQTTALENLEKEVAAAEKDWKEKSEVYTANKAKQDTLTAKKEELEASIDQNENGDLRKVYNDLSTDADKIIKGEYNTNLTELGTVLNNRFFAPELARNKWTDDLYVRLKQPSNNDELSAELRTISESIKLSPDAKAAFNKSWRSMSTDDFMTLYQEVRADDSNDYLTREEFAKKYPQLSATYDSIFKVMDMAGTIKEHYDEKTDDLDKTLAQDKEDLEKVTKELEEVTKLTDKDSVKAAKEKYNALKEDQTKKSSELEDNQDKLKNLKLKGEAMSKSKDELQEILSKDIPEIQKLQDDVFKQEEELEKKEAEYEESLKKKDFEKFQDDLEKITDIYDNRVELYKNQVYEEVVGFMAERDYVVKNNLQKGKDGELNSGKGVVTKEEFDKARKEYFENYQKQQKEEKERRKEKEEADRKIRVEKNTRAVKEAVSIFKKADPNKDFQAIFDIVDQLVEIQVSEPKLKDMQANKEKAEKLFNSAVNKIENMCKKDKNNQIYATGVYKNYLHSKNPLANLEVDGNRDMKHKLINQWQTTSNGHLPIGASDNLQKKFDKCNEVNKIGKLYGEVKIYRERYEDYVSIRRLADVGLDIGKEGNKKLKELEKDTLGGAYSFKDIYEGNKVKGVKAVPLYSDTDLRISRDVYYTLRQQEIDWMVNMLVKPYEKSFNQAKGDLIRRDDVKMLADKDANVIKDENEVQKDAKENNNKEKINVQDLAEADEKKKEKKTEVQKPAEDVKKKTTEKVAGK